MASIAIGGREKSCVPFLPSRTCCFIQSGEPPEPPPISPARGPPTDWGEFVQVHDDRDVFQGRIDDLPAIDIHSL